jgi:hypothetical protein
MGCTDFSNSGDWHLGSGNVATCMLDCGISPAADPLLMSIMHAYHAKSLKDIHVRPSYLILSGSIKAILRKKSEMKAFYSAPVHNTARESE